MKKLSKSDKKEIYNWIYEETCECIDSFSEFNECCGQNLEIFDRVNKFCQFVKIRPRFKDICQDSQKKILEMCSDLGICLNSK